MPIDVDTMPPMDSAASETGAGWWLNRLSAELWNPVRLRRLEVLDKWYAGEPDLPGVPAAARSAVREFHELSSTNFALLIAEAVRERQRVRGIRTAADDDATGDGDAFQLWLDMRMPLVSADVHRLKARFGHAFALVQAPAVDEPGVPLATAEDPRWCVADVDPKRPWRPRAGVKWLHDPVARQTRAYLYRPGRVDVAYVAARSKDAARFSASSWNWDESASGPLKDAAGRVAAELMPLVPFEALDGKGEFEQHLRLLRRINFVILQQLTIAVLQAFKQRGVKGVPLKDDKGQPIDYNDIFSADPGALWLLPAAAEIWESGQVDLSGILEMADKYVRQLSAVSRTPLPMLDPTSGNQSAEGAAAAREGLVFKVEDRNSRDGLGWSEFMRASYRWLGRDAGRVSVIWAPPQRASLAERGSALAQAKAADVPFRTRMIEFGEFDPADVDRMETEREDDLVFSRRVAALTAPPQVQGQQETPQPETATNSQGDGQGQDDEQAA